MKTDSQVLTEIATDEIRFAIDSVVGVTRVYTTSAWKDFVQRLFWNIWNSVPVAFVPEKDIIEERLSKITEFGRVLYRHTMMYESSAVCKLWAEHFFGWKSMMRYEHIEEMYEDLRVKAEYAQEKEKLEIRIKVVDRSESKHG